MTKRLKINFNEVIRQYFPKKTIFDTVSEEKIKKVENQLNKRLGKRLGFKSTTQEYHSFSKVALAA